MSPLPCSRYLVGHFFSVASCQVGILGCVGARRYIARAIDARHPSYLWRPSPPVRHDANSRPDDALARPILGHFFLSRAARGRCSNALLAKLLRCDEVAHHAAPLLAFRWHRRHRDGADGLISGAPSPVAAGRRGRRAWCGSGV
jgi:hypothetical protein